MRRFIKIATATVISLAAVGPISGQAAQICTELIPDLSAVGRESVAALSQHIVANAPAAVEACADDDTPLRLISALAALPERAGEARKLAEELVAAGNAQASNMLGAMHSNGIGGAVNDVRAAILFRQAAAAGYAPAMYNFGVARWYGLGLPADRDDAIIWLERAVAAGDPDAMSFLGLVLLTGDGIVAQRERGLDLIHAAVDAKGLRSASDAKSAYDYLASFAGSDGPGIPPHADTIEQTSRNYEAFLKLSAESGDRRFMIAQLQLGPSANESREVLDRVVLPLRPEDRLAAWLTHAAVTYGDGDQDVYEQLMLYRGFLLMSPGLDIQPYIDTIAQRLGENAAADAVDGLDVDDATLISHWQETTAECAASPASVDAYLGCAKSEALAQLLWQRGLCPVSRQDGWTRCEE